MIFWKQFLAISRQIPSSSFSNKNFVVKKLCQVFFQRIDKLSQRHSVHTHDFYLPPSMYNPLTTTFYLHPLPTIIYLTPSTYHFPSTTFYLPPSIYHPQPTTFYLPSSTCHPLPTTINLIPSTYHHLPNTFFLPPSTYYPLTTTIYLPTYLPSHVFYKKLWIQLTKWMMDDFLKTGHSWAPFSYRLSNSSKQKMCYIDCRIIYLQHYFFISQFHLDWALLYNKLLPQIKSFKDT